MGVTIENLLNVAEGVGDSLGRATDALDRRPYKTVLLVEEADGRVFQLDLPHNPESVQTRYSARWRPRQAPGVERDVSDFEGFDPASRSFSWMGEHDDPERFELTVLLALEGLMQRIDKTTLEPPRVTLQQGTQAMRGHIADLTINRIRTDKAGNARVAEIQLTLVQNDPL